MAKLLVVTVGVRSHLNRCLEFARRCRELGHEVALCCQNPTIADTVERSGFEFFALESDSSQSLARSRLGKLLDIRAFRATLEQRNRTLLKGAGLPQLLDTWSPDICLISSELHELVLIAHNLAAKVVVLEFHVSTFRQEGIPPMSSGLVPDWSPWSNSQATWSWRFLYLRRFLGRLWRRLVLGSWSKHSVIKRLVTKSGYSFKTLLSLSHWQFYTFKTLPCWIFTAPELDFRIPAARRDTVYLGPMIDQRKPAYTPEFKLEWKAWKYKDSDRPLIVVSSGSILKRSEFCRFVVDAVRELPVRVVMNFPGARLRDLGKIPDHVLVSSWIPVVRLLEMADLCVTHGGTSTLQESLSAGVPLLIYSADVMDQNGNAARVQYHQTGLRGSATDAKAISYDIQRLLDNPSYKDNARLFAQQLKGYDDQDFLRETLNEMLERSS